jgi:hypothetical protein
MAGLVMGNIGQAISGFGANIGNLMFKSIGDEADRDARIAARREEWMARLEDRQLGREENNDLKRELLEMKLDAGGGKSGSSGGGGKSGGINMEDIKPGGSQEVWMAAQMEMTVPQYTEFYNSMKSGDKTAFLQKVTTQAAPGMGAYQGQTAEQVSAETKMELPAGFEAEYKAKMKKLGALQESYALGGHYDDVMKGRQQGFQTGVGEGVLAGNIKPGAGSEAVGASLAKERIDVKGGEKLNVFTGESTTTPLGQSEIAENKAQAGSAGALSKKYGKEVEKIDAEIAGGMFNKNSNEKLNSIINSANETIKSLENSGKGSTAESKASWQKQYDDAVAIRAKAQELQKNGLEARDKPKSDATSTAMPEPKSPADLAKLKPGARYKAPDGTIRIKG